MLALADYLVEMDATILRHLADESGLESNRKRIALPDGSFLPKRPAQHFQHSYKSGLPR
jgi:hypothetical protein